MIYITSGLTLVTKKKKIPLVYQTSTEGDRNTFGHTATGVMSIGNLQGALDIRPEGDCLRKQAQSDLNEREKSFNSLLLGSFGAKLVVTLAANGVYSEERRKQLLFFSGGGERRGGTSSVVCGYTLYFLGNHSLLLHPSDQPIQRTSLPHMLQGGRYIFLQCIYYYHYYLPAR